MSAAHSYRVERWEGGKVAVVTLGKHGGRKVLEVYRGPDAERAAEDVCAALTRSAPHVA
jgi:hypothetical protein